MDLITEIYVEKFVVCCVCACPWMMLRELGMKMVDLLTCFGISKYKQVIVSKLHLFEVINVDIPARRQGGWWHRIEGETIEDVGERSWVISQEGHSSRRPAAGSVVAIFNCCSLHRFRLHKPVLILAKTNCLPSKFHTLMDSYFCLIKDSLYFK